jgi:hypothetical protein
VNFTFKHQKIGKVSAYQKISVSFALFNNDAPIFSGPFNPTVISVKEVEQKEMSDKIYSFKSPLATDKEQNTIEFKIFSKFPCECAEFIVSNN